MILLLVDMYINEKLTLWPYTDTIHNFNIYNPKSDYFLDNVFLEDAGESCNDQGC